MCFIGDGRSWPLFPAISSHWSDITGLMAKCRSNTRQVDLGVGAGNARTKD